MYRRICNVLVFFVLTIEAETCFDRRWSTPWRIFYEILSAKIPGVRLWLFDGLVLAMLAATWSEKATRQGRVKLLDLAAWISVGSVLAWGVYGAARGGDVMQMRLQLHGHVMTMVTSVLFVGVYRRVEDFVTLGKIIVAAALFRCGMAVAFLQAVVRPNGISVDCVLDHGDTVTFALALVMVLVHALHQRKTRTTLVSLAISLVLLWVIQVNNRRLAWVSLIACAMIVYFLTREVAARRRLHRALGVVLPLLSVYAIVGWGRPERIFKPLLALQQMGGATKDLSTESRNLENLGLATTLKTEPLLGTGFGHEYIEISDVLAPKDVFPMYKYDPHNSVLGLAAFMGLIGFYLAWLVYPMIAYYAARAYRFAKTNHEKTVTLCALSAVAIQVNQMFGDIGIGAYQSLVIVPIAMAAASRLAMSTGAMRVAPAAGAS